MASGSHTSPGLSFDNRYSGGIAACRTLEWEQLWWRGPDLLLRGACWICGKTTVFAGPDGRPQHLRPGETPDGPRAALTRPLPG